MVTTQQPPADTENVTGQPDQGEQNDGKTAEKTIHLTEQELKERIEASLKERLDREARKATEATERAKREAEEEALKKNQEWQQLAERNAKRISELEPLQAQVEETNGQLERYKAALTTHLTTQREGLPQHVTDLLDRLDPVDQLEWIAKNREALATPQRQGVPASARADTRDNNVNPAQSYIQRTYGQKQ